MQESAKFQTHVAFTYGPENTTANILVARERSYGQLLERNDFMLDVCRATCTLNELDVVMH